MVWSLENVRRGWESVWRNAECAILAAAVIGAFSWTTIEEAHWLTHGFWHGSLVLSILGILLAASDITVLHITGTLPSPHKTYQSQSLRSAVLRYEPLLLSKTLEGWRPRKKMVFTWQCPMMFMSYSVCAFMAGLTILVCTPLIRREGEWNAGCNIAVMYLTICALAGTVFVFCTFWIYHYVDLDFDAHSQREDDGEEDSPAFEMWPGAAQSGVMASSVVERLESRISSLTD
ncbi:hypothetical protein K458DRAFT_475164 [Lentithecium fluviatile CBS 122367]|uniref:Uncharacterized protein n=1 Tax=Lentithecium fluviatile CBS 122367 TaxID=1168545 RepID=A0A6G1JCL3_9PLEO|nr:hypothetical protein K458DRAFT_475164 [Lentithecium fluviatile CBS 122367]